MCRGISIFLFFLLSATLSLFLSLPPLYIVLISYHYMYHMAYTKLVTMLFHFICNFILSLPPLYIVLISYHYMYAYHMAYTKLITMLFHFICNFILIHWIDRFNPLRVYFINFQRFHIIAY